MLANNWSPPPLCLLALEASEPAEEAIKRSITVFYKSEAILSVQLV